MTWPQFKKKFYKKLNLKGQRDHDCEYMSQAYRTMEKDLWKVGRLWHLIENKHFDVSICIWDLLKHVFRTLQVMSIVFLHRIWISMEDYTKDSFWVLQYYKHEVNYKTCALCSDKFKLMFEIVFEVVLPKKLNAISRQLTTIQYICIILTRFEKI